MYSQNLIRKEFILKRIIIIIIIIMLQIYDDS